MIKIPYSEVLSKIKEKANLDESEVERRINEKLKQLSGLISKEGAAHIVANEMGIKLFEQLGGRLQIKKILAGMRNVEAVGKVLKVYDVREFVSGDRSGKVGSVIIGDETDSIRAVFWGAQADYLKKLKPGDIIKIVGAYVKENQGRKEIHINDRSNIMINPKGESVESVGMEMQRKQIRELSDSDDNVEIMGNVMQVFEPRFFEVCPDCGKRSKPFNGSFICPEHKEITPEFSYVINAVIDDGTETIRTAFFRQHADALLSLTSEQVLQFKEDMDRFFKKRDELQGVVVKVSGRVNKNPMFGRIEFIAQSVDPNPNPEDEIKRLQEK